MIRVLHIIPDGAVGGGNVNVGRLARSLDGRADCSFLMPQDSAQSVISLFPQDKALIGAYGSKGHPLNIARAVRKVAEGFDIIHAQGTRAAVGLVLARPFLTQKTVYTVRGYHGLRNPDLFKLKILLEKMLGRAMHHVVHVSQADHELGKTHGAFGDNAIVIPNGIELPAKITSRRSTDILFLGRLVYQKDPQSFARMVAYLPPELIVELAGEGNLGNETRALLSKNASTVNILGAVQHDEAMQAMGRARIMVMTSRWEGLPTTAIEATMMGTAVYGYHIDSLAEVLGETAETCLITERDPAALANLVKRALLTGEAEAVAQAQQKRSIAIYDARKMGKSYNDLYRAIVTQQK